MSSLSEVARPHSNEAAVNTPSPAVNMMPLPVRSASLPNTMSRAGLDQRVRGHDPLRFRQVHREVRRDVRQGHVHDHGVEHRHEDAGEDDELDVLPGFLVQLHRFTLPGLTATIRW